MSKKLDRLISQLRAGGLRLFTTADAAVALGIPLAHASVILGRAEKEGAVIRLARGRWARVDSTSPHRYAVARFLAHPNSMYITGPSAMNHHGILLQVPRQLHAAWSAKSRLFKTPLGDFYFHSLPDPGEGEFEIHNTPEGPVRLATPEKALVDTARLSASPRGKASLFPELDTDSLDQKKIQASLHRIKNPRFRKLVESAMSGITIRPPVEETNDEIVAALREFASEAGGWEAMGYFLGAGLSCNANLPIGKGLAERLLKYAASHFSRSRADELRTKLEGANLLPETIPQVLEEIRLALDREWSENVQAILRDAVPNQLFFDFVSLGGMLYLTTNLDTLIERAIESERGRSAPVSSWPGDQNDTIDAVFEIAGARVVHLHGSIEKPDSWVLTQRDYDRIQRDEVLGRFVEEALLDRPFLFIGFNLLADQDNHLRGVLKNLQANLRSWNHVHLAIFPLEEIQKDLLRDPAMQETRRLHDEFGVRCIGFKKENISEIFSELKSGIETELTPRQRSEPPWRRKLLRDARLTHARSWWRRYQEPKVVRERLANQTAAGDQPEADSDSLELHELVGGKPLSMPPSEVLNHARAILVGDFGVGKTTYLLKRYAEKSDLKDFAGPPRLYLPLREAIKGQALEALLTSRLDNGTVRAFADTAGILLVDGVDEIRADELDLLAELKQFATKYPRCRIFVTTRPEALQKTIASLAGWPVLRILPLSVSQVNEYIRERLGRDLEIDPQLQEVLRFPVFLDAYCLLLEQGGSIKANSMGAVLGSLLEMQLCRELARGSQREEPGTVKAALARDAYGMESGQIFSKARSQWCSQFNTDETLRDNLRKALIKGSILVERGDSLEFQHRVWQSYLAGLHLPTMSKEARVKAVWIESEFEGIAPHWYLALKFAAESNPEIADFLYDLRGKDSLAIARLLPEASSLDRNMWAFETLIAHYRDKDILLRTSNRDPVGGIDDEAVLGARARVLGPAADKLLIDLIESEKLNDRRLGVHIASTGMSRPAFVKKIDELLRDRESDVIAVAARAAHDFRLGSTSALMDALKNLDHGYQLTAEKILDVLAVRSPDVAREFLINEIEKTFRSNRELDSKIRWLLPKGAQLLSPEDLNRIAEFFPMDRHDRDAMPFALIQRAFTLAGEGPAKILLSGYLFGVKDENLRRLHESEEEEPVKARIHSRLIENLVATRSALVWLYKKVRNPIDMPNGAHDLFAEVVSDPLSYRADIMPAERPRIEWTAQDLANAYLKVGKKAVAKKMAKAFDFSLDPVPKDEPSTPRRARKNPRLDDAIQLYPDDWLYRITDELASKVGSLPPELRDQARNAAIRVLEKIAPDTAITPQADNSYTINRGWQNSLKIIEKLGPETFPVEIIARLSQVIKQGWYYVDRILRVQHRTDNEWNRSLVNTLLDRISGGPDDESLGHLISLLGEKGTSADDILDRLERVATQYDELKPEHQILVLCRESSTQRPEIVDLFIRRKSPLVRFKALSVKLIYEGKNVALELRREYIASIAALAGLSDPDIHDCHTWLVSISCVGIENDIADLIRNTFTDERGSRARTMMAPSQFERNAIHRWAIERLRAGETKLAVEALELLSQDSRLTHLARATEDARNNYLDRASLKSDFRDTSSENTLGATA